MLMFQPSIITRGLEKKLIDMQNDVSSIVGDFKQLDKCMGDADLFIFHLPAKVVDDSQEISTVVQVCDKIADTGKQLIIVGEKETYEDMSKAYTKISTYTWVYRPVEMEALTAAIEKSMLGKRDPNIECRILIVDDDPEYAKIVREWIKDDFRVDVITSGMKAINFLMALPENDPVDLILLDYEMPMVDGPQVFQMLRSDPVTEKIPIVFLTGIGKKDSVARVMALRPDGYILKSATKEDLLGYLKNKLYGARTYG